MPTALIIGGSVAGTRVALDLRRLGFTGEISIADEQTEAPYDRPPLSKSALTSADGAPSLLLSEEQAAAQGICLRLGTRAARLNVAGKTVVTDNGTRLNYDHLVIATGARPRPLPWPAHDRLMELRTLADGRRLRHALRTNGTIAVIGAGFIGAEVASAARGLGVEVVMIDPLPAPMSRLLGAEVGSRFAALHAAHGVLTRFGTGVDEIAGSGDGVVLRLTDGDMVTVDSAVAGIGAQPADGWLTFSGLPVDDGLVCDSRCRVLDVDEIYAAGDIARWLHPRHQELVRVEHWTNAVEQAQFVARQIVSPSADEFAPVEYVWSDKYDWKIQIAGRPERGTADHLIDQPDRSRFCALYVARNGALTGMLTVNWPKAAILGRRALAADLSPSGLRDQIIRI
jgi:phthalate 3,4-dioxygenase ferredoxin reductase subunit